MKPIDTKKLDQDEAQTLLQRLNLHSANLRALLAQTGAETIQPPALNKPEDCGLFANISSMVAHVNELEHRLGSTCPNFEFVPPQVSGTTAAPSPAVRIAADVAGGAAPKTLTEKILAARGVKTIAQLNAKCEDERNSAARKGQIED